VGCLMDCLEVEAEGDNGVYCLAEKQNGGSSQKDLVEWQGQSWKSEGGRQRGSGLEFQNVREGTNTRGGLRMSLVYS
jgi:hypothetical protein